MAQRRLFVQGNESVSCRRVLRVLHSQLQRPQANFCGFVVRSLDVIADIRVLAHIRQGYALHLAAAPAGVYIPRGCAQDFLHQSRLRFSVPGDEAYDPSDRSCVIWKTTSGHRLSDSAIFAQDASCDA